MTEITSLELAKQCSAHMHARDAVAANMHMIPEIISPGAAKVSMTITPSMLNGLGTCHGGMIFTLADTALAHACNSRNEANVAMDCRIDFLSPGLEGDLLLATATEKHKGRKSSLYEVVVSNQSGKNIALFQGRSYFIGRPVIQEAL